VRKLILSAVAVSALLAFASPAGANNYPPTTPEVTIPTTPEVTIPTTPETTVEQTTTTVGLTCGLCAGQFSPTTTVAPTTTPAPTTTVAPSTTAGSEHVNETSPPAPEVIPPAAVEATPSHDTLPVTGGSPWWLALFGACLVGLGVCAVLWHRQPIR